MQETALWNSIRANTNQGPAHGQPQVQLPFRHHHFLPYPEPMGIGSRLPGPPVDHKGPGGEQMGFFGDPIDPKLTQIGVQDTRNYHSPRPLNSVAGAVAHATSLIERGGKEQEIMMDK